MADDAQMVQGWQQTVDAAHQELQDTANTVGNGIADIVNGIASYGNAMLHDPADVIAMAGGAGLSALGAAGLVTSVGLDGTGVGTAPGLLLGAGSLAAVGGGLGIADAAGKRLADAATGADQVAPMQANIFGRAKPNDADLNDQRLHAQESQRAHDQLEATGKVPKNVPPPRNSSAWDTYKRKNNLAP